MRVAGIVAEYNPFHLGHAYHLHETRRILGDDTGILCVMSGNFVQRGEAAIMDKWARAECALRCGADLVLELPTPWATASAEAFARGAVELMTRSGIADTISFGSEGGGGEELSAAAEALLTPAYRAALGRELKEGIPFAAARQRAVRELIGHPADCLSEPNNNLAVEYIKALRSLGTPMAILPVSRRGAGHDAAEASDGFASASAVRDLCLAGRWEDAERWIPGETAEILNRSRALFRSPASLALCERAILARLRTMTERDFAALPDSGAAEGLPRRMIAAAREGKSLEEVCALAKTKRYAHARLRRLILWAFLGIRREDCMASPPYLRVLGVNARGRLMLRNMEHTASLPVLVKSAHVKRLDGASHRLFELEARCTDLYGLCLPRVAPCGQEWTTGPVILGASD